MKLLSILLTMIFLLVLPDSSIGQEIKVQYSNKAVFATGKKIRKNKILYPEDEVIVRTGGRLHLLYGRWFIQLEEGRHPVDSVIEAEKARTEFITDQSIHHYLKENNLLDCEREWRACAGGIQDGSSSPYSLIASSDTVTLQWKFSTPYEGKYYIIINNIFDEYLALYITEKEQFDLILHDEFKKNGLIIYYVIRGDCLRSEEIAVRIEKQN